MIERYQLPEMAELFSDQARLQAWLEVELAACEASEKAKLVPSGTAERIRAKARIDAERALEIESEVHHDVIAFLTMLAESAGREARYLHQGMTSSDLVDSALAITVKRAGEIMLTAVDDLRAAALELARAHRETICIGRTHGVHAEPTIFGLRALSWATELSRTRRRLANTVSEAATGKLSGSVGNFAHLPPSVEEDFCARLGIGHEPVASQIVGRDRLAALVTSLAVLGGAIERIAIDIRLGQRTECGELFEPFSSGQKGSSSMPHTIPVLCS